MVYRMTSGQRMAAIISGEKPDRVPVVPFVQGYCSKITGISLGDFYADGDKCFEAQFASMRLHGYEQTPNYGYASCGAYEFGGKIEFPYGKGHGAPFVKRHPVMNIEDIDTLEVPDFYNDVLPGAYNQADIVASKCHEIGLPVNIQIGSVFTTASVVADTSEFITWLMIEPKAVHSLLKKVTNMYINAATYFAEKYGAENLLVFDGGPSESSKLISPEMFEEFAYPYMKKVHEHLRYLGIQTVLMHPCSDQNKNIPYYLKMRQEMDWYGKYIWIINPPLFLTSTYKDLVEICREAILEGMNSPSGFILASGCEFPVDASPAKLMAMMDAAEKYGKYD